MDAKEAKKIADVYNEDEWKRNLKDIKTAIQSMAKEGGYYLEYPKKYMNEKVIEYLEKDGYIITSGSFPALNKINWGINENKP